MTDIETTTEDDRWLALKGLRALLGRHVTLAQVEHDLALTPLARELLYGSCRFYFSLAAAVDGRLQRPLRRKDEDLRALLILATYQLYHTRIPQHAVVHTAVELTRKLKKTWAKGLVNGTLRQLVRNLDKEAEPSAPSAPRATPAELSPTQTDHPQWLIDSLIQQYPEQAAALMQANNQRAPMALRVNTQRYSVAELARLLNDAGVAWEPGYRPETVILQSPIARHALSGITQGLISIQDAGAQLAAACWAPNSTAPSTQPPVQRLLDACAAPGGKLHHALEYLQPKDFIALEWQPTRLAALKAEAHRLGHQAQLGRYVQGDATNLAWWDGRGFDRILVDAPCSGTGTLRRHPDIKLHPNDIARHATKQLQLLKNLWVTLQEGGQLLYCTCSLLQAENDDVIAQFLATQSDAVLLPFTLPTGNASQFGWQLTPLDPATDGFYYARLQRGPKVLPTGTRSNGDLA